MLKTRSLFPRYGKDEVNGSYYGQYMLEFPPSLSAEDTVRYYHGLGSTRDWSTYTPTYAMGEEKFYSTENYFKPNECIHDKLERVNLPYTIVNLLDRSYGWRVGVDCYCRWVWDQYSPPPVDWAKKIHRKAYEEVGQNLRAEAYWTMRPKFEGQVSMLNFLFELKDFRDIAKIFSSADSLRNPLKMLLQSDIPYDQFAKAWRKKPPSPTKLLAEAHLINSFALKPLISDLSKIFQELHEMVDEAERKFQTNGEGTTRHFSSKVGPVATPTEVQGGSGYKYFLGVKYESLFTATADMKYQYKLKSAFDKQVAYWGLALNAESVWNALPFSFLVDYFLSVGKALHAMRQDKDVTNFSVYEYQESVSTGVQYGRYISAGPVPSYTYLMGLCVDDEFIPPSSNSIYLIDGWEAKYYVRELATPYFGPALPKFKCASGSQLINMVALARCFF